MDMKLEVVVVPVSDVDRAKQFYKGLGWREDADFVADESFRIVQLTPPGSGGSIQFGVGLTAAPPGSLRGMYLVVDDIEAARAELAERGAAVSEVFHEARLGGRFRPEQRAPGGSRVRRASGRPTGRSCRSTTRTATAGSCRRSPPACPDASEDVALRGATARAYALLVPLRSGTVIALIVATVLASMTGSLPAPAAAWRTLGRRRPLLIAAGVAATAVSAVYVRVTRVAGPSFARPRRSTAVPCRIPGRAPPPHHRSSPQFSERSSHDRPHRHARPPCASRPCSARPSSSSAAAPGIGLETARRARTEGAQVVLTGRDPERLARAAADVGAARHAAFDATTPTGSALPRLAARSGRPRHGQRRRPVLRAAGRMDVAEACRDVADHLRLILEVARYAAGTVRPGGTLPFIGGTGGRRPHVGIAVTALLTAGCPALAPTSRSSSPRCASTWVAAGFVDTPLSASLLGDDLEARREELRATLPIRRVVGPADVAALAVHLMVNTALTGATFDVDGGQQVVIPTSWRRRDAGGAPVLLSVNVGLPKDVAWQGRTVHTGVWKQPVDGPRDGAPAQHRRRRPGRPRRARRRAARRARLPDRVLPALAGALRPGRLRATASSGRTSPSTGCADDEVCIGDRYRIGEAEFEVTQPRVTCYRVGMRMGEPRDARAAGRPPPPGLLPAGHHRGARPGRRRDRQDPRPARTR